MENKESNGAPVFSLVPQRREIIIEDQAGARRTYEVREMLAAEKDKYLNLLAKRMQYHPDTGRPQGIQNFEGMQAELLTRCMFLVSTPTGPADPPVPVTAKEIAAWPATASSAIYQIASEINRIEGEKQSKEEEAAKNE